MNNTDTRLYDALIRIQTFFEAHSSLAEPGTRIGDFVEQLKEGVLKLSESGISQSMGHTAIKVSTGARAEARAALRNQLTTLCRTAVGLELKGFWLPGDVSDWKLVEISHGLLKIAEPVQQMFIDGLLPPDFLERLKMATQNLEDRIKVQGGHRRVRRNATQSIAETRAAIKYTLQRLDPMMENLLRDSPPTLVEWKTARPVVRSPEAGAAKTAP